MDSPLGILHIPLYTSMATRARDAEKSFTTWEDDKKADAFVTGTIHPLLLNVDALKESTLYVLNTGLLEESIRRNLKSSVTLPRELDELPMIDRFLPEQDWGKKKLRIVRTHSVTEELYQKSLGAADRFPLISQTMKAMQDIVASHYANISRQIIQVRAPTDINAEYTPLETVVKTVCNSAAITFLNELMPYIALSGEFYAAAKPDVALPMDKVFSYGLTQAFRAKAFSTRNVNKDPELNNLVFKCPFSSPIAQFWNMDVAKGRFGRYKLTGQQKAGAFPALISRLVQKNDSQNRFSPS